MRRKWLVLSLAAVGLVVLLGGGYAGYEWLRYVYREDPHVSPAPEDSGFAPRWPSGTPRWHWPADFKLPLKIVLDDLPEVPERLVGPSPPIEEEEELGPSPPIEEEEELVPSPPIKEEEELVPSPPIEEEEELVPSPPVEEEKE